MINKRIRAAALIIVVAASTAMSLGCRSSDHGVDRVADLPTIRRIASDGQFKPTWESLANYHVPDWYRDAKFGIFVHWGVYSVPAFRTEWYPRDMYSGSGTTYQHHLRVYGPVTEFGYKDFIPLFTAENFNADSWMQIFKRSGAKYIIPVAEHHDGFAMYDSDYSDWTAAKMGPKRDVIGELAVAAKDHDLVFGLSSHRAENWWYFGNGRKIDSDVQDDRYRGLYGPARDRAESESGVTPPTDAFLDDWLLRSAELVEKYQPQVFWFDWWIAQDSFDQHLREFSAYYYNRGSSWDEMVAINYKKHGGDSFPDTAGVLDIERGRRAEIRELFWQTDTSISKASWGYVTEPNYKEAGALIDDLIDIVSKNGSLLLNVGPKPDGTIPEEEVEILDEIGDWLSVNGEAIYGTRPWQVFGEGPTSVIDGTMMNDAERNRTPFGAGDIRFTQKPGVLYAILLQWPGDDRTVTIKSVTPGRTVGAIEHISLLGNDSDLAWDLSEGGLSVTLPNRISTRHAHVLRVELSTP